MSSLRLTHLGPSLCTRRCVWSSARPLSLPRAAEMPPKKTGRGANLSLLNKEHPKDKKGDDDIGDLEYVDKPDDSSSSGESTSGEALPLVQSTLPFSGASSARKKGKNKRPRAAEGPSQRTLADFMPLLLDRGDADLELGERSKRVIVGGRDVGHFLARERLELLHAARGRGARFLEGVRRACRAAGEDREVVAAADIDGAFDVNGSLFDEALKA